MGPYVDFDTFSIHWIFNELFVTVMCHFFSEKIENSIYIFQSEEYHSRGSWRFLFEIFKFHMIKEWTWKFSIRHDFFYSIIQLQN